MLVSPGIKPRKIELRRLWPTGIPQESPDILATKPSTVNPRQEMQIGIAGLDLRCLRLPKFGERSASVEFLVKRRILASRLRIIMLLQHNAYVT